MKTKPIDNVKLGIFVVAGLLFFIFSLYMIGLNRNLFGSTFTIQASFHNVNGLTQGNNVRFAGIDVGTVRRIEIESDTSIIVTMVIDKKARNHIKKNSLASVGSDGLMGNKLVDIYSGNEYSPTIEEGDRIHSLKPIETDEMLRTLNTTNENFEVISTDLRKITQKINNSNSLWRLLSDTVITMDLKEAVKSMRDAGQNASKAGNEILLFTQSARKGEGLIGTLLTDTLLSFRLNASLEAIHKASAQTVSATHELDQMLSDVKKGEGALGVLLTDTLMMLKLNRSLDNIEEGTYRFNENMEAMKHHFLFRGYFRKMEKDSSKTLNQ